METQRANKQDIDPTIGEMVAKDYRKAEIFKRFGLDFCCGGKKTVNVACSEKGIDAGELEEALKELDTKQHQEPQDFNEMELDDLTTHIVDRHHAYVNAALPLLDEFSAKVAKVHGDANPEVIEILHHYNAVANELRMHMQKEEVVLFPFILQMATSKRHNQQLSPPPFGTIAHPINMMEMEHVSAGSGMAAIRELSDDYSPPNHACNTYRVLYAKLQEFEEDLHQHIHLENNILFPKAIGLEAELLN